MNTYSAQSARQTPRLQTTQKTPLGNGLAGGWGIGLHSGNAASLGAALGNVSGVGAQSRPVQLSGFAQVMGGGNNTQNPIDMRPDGLADATQSINMGVAVLAASDKAQRPSGLLCLSWLPTIQTQADQGLRSDFPTLSGGSRAHQPSSAVTGWNANTIRQSSTQPTAQISQSQSHPHRAPSTAPSIQSIDQFDASRSRTSVDRSTGGDEFPPLGGQINGESAGQIAGFPSVLASPEVQLARTSTQSQLSQHETSSNFAQQSQVSIATTQNSLHQAAPLQQNGLASSRVTSKPFAEMTKEEQWGLPGLIAAFEARRIMDGGGHVDEGIPAGLRSAVLLGQDLNTMSLDLDSLESIYPCFAAFPSTTSSAAQFDFHDRHVVPEFSLPPAYTVTNVPPLASRLNAFSDETLFSVFYQHPRDILQEMAASELTGRDWRWHKILRQWLQKDSRESNTGSSLPIVDLATGTPIGTPTVRIGERTERGVYVFFDALNWRRERREFILDFEQLDHRHSGQSLAGSSGANVGAVVSRSNVAMPPVANTVGVQQMAGSSQLHTT